MAFMRKVKELKENPMSTGIYGAEEDLSDLLESIPRCGGIIVPLLVKPDGTIISGHRRYRAAKQLGIEAVPCEGCDPQSPEEEMVLVIEANKNRVKTTSQIYEEGQKLTAALAELASRRKLQNLKYNSENGDNVNSIDVANLATSINGGKTSPAKGRTVTAVADSLGLSDKTWQRIQYVGRYAEMRNSVAMDAMSKLNAGKITVNKAYNMVCASLKLAENAGAEGSESTPADAEAPMTPQQQLVADLLQADELLKGLLKIFEGFQNSEGKDHPAEMFAWRKISKDFGKLSGIFNELNAEREERKMRGFKKGQEMYNESLRAEHAAKMEGEKA